MALCEKILIVGFSGAGKTTLLRKVERSAPDGWLHFDDLDELVLQNKREVYQTLNELIESEGWETFRLWERQQLEGWLKQEGKGVLALGGGALSPQILELYKNSHKVKIVHLAVTFETCWQRLSMDLKHQRPLVKLGREKMRELFLTREQLFHQLAHRLEGESDLKGLEEQFWLLNM